MRQGGARRPAVNRLVQVVKSGSTTNYAYGPDSSRIRTTAVPGLDPGIGTDRAETS